MRISTLVLIAVGSLSLTIPASASDLKIVTRNSTGANSATVLTEYLGASASRTETADKIDNLRGHRVVNIVQYGEAGNQNFMLDLDAHEYTSFETDKRGITLGAKAIPAKYSGGTVDIWIDSKDTGERQEMFGHIARHIITTTKWVPGPKTSASAAETQTDGWYIDDTILPTWRRPKPNTFHFISLSHGGQDQYKLHRSGVEPGFPVKVITTQHLPATDANAQATTLTNVSEIVEFTEAPVDPALFQVPSDFRRVDQLGTAHTLLPAKR